jgi:type III secretory pathway lipoprotein EscJ
MNRILLSWPTEKIIHEMQKLLIDHGILALTQPTQFDSHVTHYMLLTDDTDYANAVHFIKTNHKSLGLPSELWGQFKQRTGHEL